MSRLAFLLALLISTPLAGCPAPTDDDDSASDDDDSVSDDDDSVGDDDDSAGDDDDSVGDDDDSVGDDDDDTAAAFAPEAGDYDYGLFQFSVNECAASQSVLGEGIEVHDVNLKTERFSFTSTDPGVPTVDCFYDQTQIFVCNPTAYTTNLSSIGMPNATISRQDTNSGGTWTSSTTATFENSVTMNCSGSQCAIAGSAFGIPTWPCTSTYTTTATLIEE